MLAVGRTFRAIVADDRGMPSRTPFTSLAEPTRVNALDVDPREVRRAVAQGDLIRLSRGVVMHDPQRVTTERLRTRAMTVQLRLPGAVLSHATAAQLHGIPYFLAREADEPIHAIVRRGAGNADRVRLHDLVLANNEWTTYDGLRITTPARTALDLALQSSLPWAVAAFDAATRLMILEAAGVQTAGMDRDFATARRIRSLMADEHHRREVLRQLRLSALHAKGRHGIGTVRQALPLVEPCAESPLESISRVAMKDRDLPTPEVAFAIVVDGVEYWTDFAWPHLGVIGEADGQAKYDIPGVRDREAVKYAALVDAGWTIVRWTWDDVFPDATRMAGRIRAALMHRRAA